MEKLAPRTGIRDTNWIAEYRFHPESVGGFDHFGVVREKVAVEIEGVGITYKGGRHQHLNGFLKDADQVRSSFDARLASLPRSRSLDCMKATGIWRPEVMTTLKHLLGVA